LDKIDPFKIAGTIVVGSLVKANGIYLYLSLALPKINIEGMLLLCSTITTGKQVDGKYSRFTFEINGTKYLVESIS
jgi:hypothetical protein